MIFFFSVQILWEKAIFEMVEKKCWIQLESSVWIEIYHELNKTGNVQFFIRIHFRIAIASNE